MCWFWTNLATLIGRSLMTPNSGDSSHVKNWNQPLFILWLRSRGASVFTGRSSEYSLCLTPTWLLQKCRRSVTTGSEPIQTRWRTTPLNSEWRCPITRRSSQCDLDVQSHLCLFCFLFRLYRLWELHEQKLLLLTVKYKSRFKDTLTNLDISLS